MQASLRKYQNSLFIIGAGVIVLGIWSVLKFFLSYYLGEGPLAEALNISADESGFSANVLYLFIMFFLVIDLMARMYVGLSAMAEGQGRKKGSFYVVLAGLMVFFSAVGVVMAAAGFFVNGEAEEAEPILDRLVSLIIEFTSFAVILDLFVSAVRVKKLRRKGVI